MSGAGATSTDAAFAPRVSTRGPAAQPGAGGSADHRAWKEAASSDGDGCNASDSRVCGVDAFAGVAESIGTSNRSRRLCELPGPLPPPPP